MGPAGEHEGMAFGPCQPAMTVPGRALQQAAPAQVHGMLPAHGGHCCHAASRSMGARHAARPAAAAAELTARDGDDLDAVLAQHRVGRHVALVAEHDARCDGEVVGPVVPLLALGGPDVLVGPQHGHAGHIEHLRQLVPQAAVARHRHRAVGARGQGPRPQVAVKIGIHDERGAVDHRHDRVKVHHGPRGRQLDRDHRVRLPAGEQGPGQDLDRHRMVRSPMPASTAPLPSTCTSPPSTEAGRCPASSSP